MTVNVPFIREVTRSVKSKSDSIKIPNIFRSQEISKTIMQHCRGNRALGCKQYSSLGRQAILFQLLGSPFQLRSTYTPFNNLNNIVKRKYCQID